MYAAVDIGGTKTLVAVFDNYGEIIEKNKFPTPEDYEIFISELATTVDNFSTHEFQAVSVAAPGTIDHSEGILLHAGNLAWKNAPIQADIERLFKAPSHLENDAKAATVSESRLAGATYKVVVYITVSTGIGVGVCVNGNLDKTLLDAEPGMMNIEKDGEMVTWESITSGKAIVAKYGKRASEIDDPAIWSIIAHDIAKGLLAIIAIVQPDLIIFGGGVGSHFEKFEKPLLAELKKYENPLAPTPPIKMAVHPEEAVIYGCYELAKDFANA
jgi:predicted NBD/HSP70 family sugar kinase